MKLKRSLYLTHRWLGIVMSCFVAMWFISGVVMMYVAFPQLTEQERFEGLPPLKAGTIKVPLKRLTQSLPDDATIEKLLLTTVLERPVYLLKVTEQPWQGMYADSGERLLAVNRQQAMAAAHAFARHSQPVSDSQLSYATLLELDQWSLSSSLQPHRPLHLVQLNDAAGSELYISSVTGQVVRDTTGNERLWNWLGANLHWIYPVQIRKHGDIWSNLLIGLSLAGLIALITGTVIGVLRIRINKPYRGTSWTPYRGVMKYHHLLGFVCVLFLTSYLFSGLMSMNPWNIFTDKEDFSQPLERYRTHQPGFKPNDQFDPVFNSVASLRDSLLASPGVKEISWHWLGGQAYRQLYRSVDQRVLDLPATLAVNFEQQIENALARLMPGGELQNVERLDRYDAYYYSHHERYRPLPAWRAKYNDAESSWFHVDLSSGELLERLTAKARVQRWFYNGLHSLDFGFLIERRPLWDVVVISLCSLGLIFSATALLIAYRRLRFNAKRTAKAWFRRVTGRMTDRETVRKARAR